VSDCSRGCKVLHITDAAMTGWEDFTGVGGASCWPDGGTNYAKFFGLPPL